MGNYKIGFSVFFLSCVLSLFAEPITVSFQRGGWSPDQWVMTKSPRWDYRGTWKQLDDAIVNAVPADVTAQDMMGPRASETYTSMLWKEPVTGNFALSSTMSFQYQMAPLLVLAPEVVADGTGYAEYREHWEVVLYNEGINIWRHRYEDGKPCWHLAASAKYKFLPETKYNLTLQVQRFPYGARITVTCGDAKLTYTEHDLPEKLQVGLTGCEGPCNFYDFRLENGK